jgi:LacI family transcriptional regulator
MPTIYDVAALAGVSPKTVSRVINGSTAVRPSTRQKVYDAIAELGFVPNLYARGIAADHTGVIGIYHCGSRFFSDALRLRTRILAGFEDVMASNGYRLLLHSAVGQPQDVDHMEHLAKNVDGVFVVGLPGSSERRQMLRLLEQGFPLVSSGRRQVGQIEAYAAAPDNRYNVAAVVEYFLTQQRKRIGLVLTTTVGEHNEDRLLGYIEGLQCHNINYEADLVFFTQECEDKERALRQWLIEVEPDAVFVAEENTALALAKAARSLSRRIPENLAVVTNEDNGSSRLLESSLVRMDRRDHEIGVKGAGILLALIAGKDVQPRTHLVKGRLELTEGTVPDSGLCQPR